MGFVGIRQMRSMGVGCWVLGAGCWVLGAGGWRLLRGFDEERSFDG